jgi:hypothetical protein
MGFPMSETVVRVKTKEITKARVICHKCHTVVEVPIDRLAAEFGGEQCRFCGTYFTDKVESRANLIVAFAKALNDLTALADEFEIELVISERPSSEQPET